MLAETLSPMVRANPGDWSAALNLLQNLESLVPIVLIAGVGVGAVWFLIARSKAILKRWARHNGFEILTFEYAWHRCPYYQMSARNQTVYRVRVRDASGKTRFGWVRCGSWRMGLLSNKAEVIWD